MNTLSQELKDLEARRNEIISKMKDIAKNNVIEASKENTNIEKRLSKNCFTVKFSTISEKGWSPKTLDWEACVDDVITYLNKFPVQDWKDVLIKKMNESKGKTVPFTRRLKTFYGGYVTDTICTVDKDFLEKIIEKI